MKVLVSIIMSVYNGEKYLFESIESIINQTFKDFEFIIINDGSIDTSLEIIQNFQAIDKRIVLINRENRGLISSLNEGMSIACGEYIARMDADDISYPQRIQKQVDFLQRNQHIDLCGSWIRTFNENNSKLYKYPQFDIQIKATFLFQNPLAHPSIMFRKNLFSNYYPYRDIEDYATWLFLAPNAQYENLQTPLLHYRKHSENTCKRTNNQQANYENLINDFIQYYGIPIEFPQEHINVYFCNDRSFTHINLQTLENFYIKILNYVFVNYSAFHFSLKIEILKKLGKLYLKNLAAIRIDNIFTFVKILIKC